MTTQNLALFEAIGAKIDYLNQRQRVISQNISNADTPGYRPQDLVPGDFGSILKDVTKGKDGVANVTPETTTAGHIGGPNDIRDPQARKNKDTYEVAPAGNAVIVEEQLITSGQNMIDYNMMLNLMQKNVSMIKTSLGRQQ